MKYLVLAGLGVASLYLGVLTTLAFKNLWAPEHYED